MYSNMPLVRRNSDKITCMLDVLDMSNCSFNSSNKTELNVTFHDKVFADLIFHALFSLCQ